MKRPRTTAVPRPTDYEMICCKLYIALMVYVFIPLIPIVKYCQCTPKKYKTSHFSTILPASVVGSKHRITFGKGTCTNVRASYEFWPHYCSMCKCHRMQSAIPPVCIHTYLLHTWESNFILVFDVWRMWKSVAKSNVRYSSDNIMQNTHYCERDLKSFAYRQQSLLRSDPSRQQQLLYWSELWPTFSSYAS